MFTLTKYPDVAFKAVKTLSVERWTLFTLTFLLWSGSYRTTNVFSNVKMAGEDAAVVNAKLLYTNVIYTVFFF